MTAPTAVSSDQPGEMWSQAMPVRRVEPLRNGCGRDCRGRSQNFLVDGAKPRVWPENVPAGCVPQGIRAAQRLLLTPQGPT
jgi:hypothetical protein